MELRCAIFSFLRDLGQYLRFSVVKTRIIDRGAVPLRVLYGHFTWTLLDQSAKNADRKSVIGADQTIFLVIRTQIPLSVLFPIILGPNERYKGS
ncbi:hypothetical protein D3C75_912780 [compost metagenome]